MAQHPWSWSDRGLTHFERTPGARRLGGKFIWVQLSNDPFLEKNLEFMIECTEEFSNEQYTYQSYQRQLIKQQQQQQLYLAKRVRTD